MVINTRTIITPGSQGHVDIDGIACAIALYEFFTQENKQDISVCWSNNKTASIPERFDTVIDKYKTVLPKEYDNLILVDVSDSNFLENICNFNLDKVIKIFDHHPGYEKFWKSKIGKNAIIEKIGAAATLVTEFLIKQNKFDIINKTTKELLACAIVSNTVNFTAKITKNTDKIIFQKILTELGYNEKEFINQYFQEIDQKIFNNPEKYIKNDAKEILIKKKKITIFQIEMMKNDIFVKENRSCLKHNIQKRGEFAFAMVSSFFNNNTYFVAYNDVTKGLLEQVLGGYFINNIMIYDRVILRKELINKILQQNIF